MAKRRITELDLQGARPPTSVMAMVGHTFGSLTVLHYSGVVAHRHYVRCRCACGRDHLVMASHLAAGRIRSCGCLHGAHISESRRRHGYAPLHGKRKKSYSVWRAMNARCYKKTDGQFKNYGGRGIAICERWRGENGFQNFLSDMGEPSEGMSIERKDNDLGYSPENCIWIPLVEQAKNRRRNWKIVMDGEVVSARVATRNLGLKINAVAKRCRVLGLDKASSIPIEAIFA